MNYGQDETVLDLGRHRYDDLAWHTVKVTTSDDIITMTVDGSTTVREPVKGKFKLLNIDAGVFLGGTGTEVQSMFDNKLKNLRGAFSEVTLNGNDLISMAKGLTDQRHLVEVSWDIDPVFDAPRDSPISFLSETSFSSFSQIHPSNERTVSFMLQTESETALLLYSSTRHSSEQHFIALEIIQRQLKLTVRREQEIASIVVNYALDKKWHQIDLSVAPHYMELTVDSAKYTRQLDENISAVYGGLIFIGGINQRARRSAINQGLESLSGSRNLKGGTIGCVKDVIINSRSYSIHDIHASRLIGAQCDTDCDKGDCKMTSSSRQLIPHSNSNQDPTQLISISPVTVKEGEQVEVTTDNIEVVYDFKRLGIRESQIMFHIVEKPKYGEVRIDSGRRRNQEAFTYLDVIGGKVTYMHHGSEEDNDEISMELEIVKNSRNDDNVPQEMQQRYDFVLLIFIQPTNDRPRIILGNNGELRIIENTKIRITSDFLLAKDSDTPADQLTYVVTKSPNQGYFTKLGQNEIPISNFTQEEVNDRNIWFLHPGSGDVTVELKVTDGHLSSRPVNIAIKTVPLQLILVKNSGLVLPHGSFAEISSENLTFTSNVPTQELEITYDILNPPRYGVLEKQQYVGGKWQRVQRFAQRHIDNGQIRYRQNYEYNTPTSDQFKFTVKAKSYTTTYYYFRIQFEQVYLQIKSKNKLTLLDTPYGVLSEDNLQAVTNNPTLPQEQIVFTIARPPQFGNFIKVEETDGRYIDFSHAVFLTERFTQADIYNRNVYYRLKADTFETVTDYSDLRVEASGSSAKILRLWIEYVPRRSDVIFINNGLEDVVEGAQKVIERSNLFIQTDKFQVFDFTVVSEPEYGVLQIIDPRSSAVVAADVKEFTSYDIRDLSLVYKHDDSENSKDSFTFTAVPKIQKSSLTPSNIPEFSGTFEIHMLMRNDNAPKRLVDKVFKVVRNSERLITLDDIAFADDDVDYDAGKLTYTRRAVTNGQIVSAQDRSEQIYEFTQKDIADNKIMFVHMGEDIGRADMYVTDGQFYTNCLLEIEAGDPFVSVLKNTGAVVRKNDRVKITSSNISIETNLNVPDTEVHFVLTNEPTYGYLIIDGYRIDDFTLETLKSNKLFYKNEGGTGVHDFFTFMVKAGDATDSAKFSIEVVLETAQLPPSVVNNLVLEAYVGSSSNVIGQNHLLITHTDSAADSVEYLILVLPKHGHLYVRGKRLSADGEMTFTQSDINSEFVTYEIENTTATKDSFMFEVSNGYNTLRGLEFLIDILPYSLPFEVRNFSVIEGGVKTLTSQILRVDQKFTTGQRVQFMINAQPKFGRLELATHEGVPILTFSSSDLQNRRVSYVHDNSESKMDWFSVSCRLQSDRSKESQVETVYITVEGINDEIPSIVRNQGLRVWKGSMTQITSDILLARDLDSTPDELVYRISSPSNGHVSMLNNTFKALTTFRQSWIDQNLLVFVHEGNFFLLILNILLS